MLKKIKKHSRPAVNSFLSWGPNTDVFTSNKRQKLFKVRGTHVNMSIVCRTKFIKKHNSRHILKRFYINQRLRYRFKGKAYRVKIKTNVIFMRFHRSHKTHMYYKNIELRYLKNKGFDLKMYMSHESWLKFKWWLNYVRPRNFFTARGIWNRDALFYKKKGKISGYR